MQLIYGTFEAFQVFLLHLKKIQARAFSDLEMGRLCQLANIKYLELLGGKTAAWGGRKFWTMSL